MSWVEKCWMVTSKISVIALLMITGIYFGKFVCPYIKKKKGAVAVSIVYITIMLVLYMIPPQIDNFSAYLIGVMAAFLAMDVERSNADVAGELLRAQVGLGGEESAEGFGRQGAVREDQRCHDLVADLGIRHRVDRGLGDAGMAQQDPLDRGGAQVLPVHAHPLGGPAGEVAETRAVDVGEIAAPVHAAAHPLRIRLRTPVVTRERPRTGGVDELTDRLGVQQPPVARELRGRAGSAGVRIEHGHARPRPAERARRRVRGALHDHPALGRAEAVHDPAPEAFREPRQVPFGALVAVGDAQRVVRVVRAFRCGEHERERFADVVGVGRAEPPHVRQEPGRREPPPQRERRPRGQRHRPPGEQRVRVEQRHRHVHHVAAGELEALRQHEPGLDELRMGAAHRLRLTTGPGGEHQRQQILRSGRDRI